MPQNISETGSSFHKPPTDVLLSEDFFSLLSLPRSFDVNDRHLEQNHFAMQRRYHPDRFAGKSRTEREEAKEMVMHLNTAYQTLRSPQKRAEYLLFLKGIRLNGEVPDVHACPDTRKEIQSLSEAKNEAKTPEDIHRLNVSVRDREAECLLQLRDAFHEHNDQEAAELTIRLKLLTELAEAMRDRLFDFYRDIEPA